MQIGLLNAWLLSLPMIVIFAYVATFHRDAARRMADMSGYAPKEKAAAVLASTAPYPFMILTIFTLISSSKTAVIPGALSYAIGLIGFLSAVTSYTKISPGELAMQGIYKISRNPMYVSALLMFAGIVIMTLNVFLTVLLVIIIILHHKMIQAEETACARRFGKTYERYRENTPRYLFF